jgi:hypothetical protein
MSLERRRTSADDRRTFERPTSHSVAEKRDAFHRFVVLLQAVECAAVSTPEGALLEPLSISRKEPARPVGPRDRNYFPQSWARLPTR